MKHIKLHHTTKNIQVPINFFLYIMKPKFKNTQILATNPSIPFPIISKKYPYILTNIFTFLIKFTFIIKFSAISARNFDEISWALLVSVRSFLNDDVIGAFPRGHERSIGHQRLKRRVPSATVSVLHNTRWCQNIKTARVIAISIYHATWPFVLHAPSPSSCAPLSILKLASVSRQLT